MMFVLVRLLHLFIDLFRFCFLFFVFSAFCVVRQRTLPLSRSALTARGGGALVGLFAWPIRSGFVMCVGRRHGCHKSGGRTMQRRLSSPPQQQHQKQQQCR